MERMDKNLATELATYVATKAREMGIPCGVAVVNENRTCRALAGDVEPHHLQNAIELAEIGVSDLGDRRPPFCRRFEIIEPKTATRTYARTTVYGAIAVSGEYLEESRGLLDGVVELFLRRYTI